MHASRVRSRASDRLSAGFSATHSRRPVDAIGAAGHLHPDQGFARGSSYDDTVGNAHYNALQTKYERRLAHGLTALATYTWAKTLTNAGDLLSG